MAYVIDPSRRGRQNRRQWLRLASAGVAAASTSGWIEALAEDAASHPKRSKACILLWMGGGPSQMDTFDLKPGHAHGGPFKEIATAAPGVRFSEHLPKIAKHADRMAVVRPISTKEGDHTRATQLLHTGYLTPPTIQFPTIGSLIAKELGSEESALPNFVSISSTRIFGAPGAGFLGPKYAPMTLGEMAYNANDADYE